MSIACKERGNLNFLSKERGWEVPSRDKENKTNPMHHPSPLFRITNFLYSIM